MPASAPLDMPIQNLAGGMFSRPAPLRFKAPSIARRRFFMVVGSLMLGAVATQQMYAMLATDGFDGLDVAFAVLFFALFTWISFGFLGAVAGFATLADGPTATASPTRLPVQPTAVLLTICNEDLDAVARRLRAMTDSIDAIGAAHLFDFFVLSDSAVDGATREARTFERVRAASASQVFYRRRLVNHARKPGNIADWVRGHGAAYDSMIVLDADSLMSGKAMAELAVRMEENSGLGLLQTIPTIIEGHTFFARWQQFAASVYGHVASAGLQWWSGSEATFWGHNAVIRVRAFAESCGLPALTGAEPFGGDIMSHDMLEAALLRRRGWAVQMVILPDGSHEEFPPTLADHAKRDRRWCQGNLQHLRLLGVARLHWVSRLQLLMGASAYLTSPFWLLLLLIGVVQEARAEAGFAVVPQPWLLALTGMLLFGPKLIALLWVAIDADHRRRLGGVGRVAATMAIEIPLSTLVAPIIMLGQTVAIADIVRGRPSGWLAQRRVADGLAPLDALQIYGWHMALGLAFMMAGIGGVGGGFWMMPVAVSLLVAPLTAMVLSRRDVGAWLCGNGRFISAADGPAARAATSA